MNITYRRKHNESYMLIEENEEGHVHEQLMIENNHIDRLLDISRVNVDGKKLCYYNISKKESLSDYLEHESLDRDLFEKIVMHIYLGLEELNRYLIDTNHVLLTPQTIFLNKDQDAFKMYLCYHADEKETIQVQFRQIMEYCLKVVPNDDKSFLEMIYELYEICQLDDYTILQLIEKIHDYKFEKREIYVEQIELQDDFSEEQIVEEVKARGTECIAEYYDEEVDSVFVQLIKRVFGKLVEKKKEKQLLQEKYMEDFIVEPDMKISEPTVLLTADNTSCIGKLVYEGNKTEENFIINQETFRIGNSGGNNHGIIHAKEVSRYHAKIIHTEDGYFLEDLNSTNGTKLNGKNLSYRAPVKLKPMDSICFADVPYVFI